MIQRWGEYDPSYGEQFLEKFDIGIPSGLVPADRNNRYSDEDIMEAASIADSLVRGAPHRMDKIMRPFTTEAIRFANTQPRSMKRVALNDALMNDLGSIYRELGGRGSSYYMHPQESGTPRAAQAMSGEYLYRMLFPDEIVAPFARSYNDEHGF
jgi:hypothetical protein